MSDRFFVAPLPADAAEAQLLEAEAHHFARVMRGQEGDEIVLFDGTGWEYRGRVTKIQKHAVSLEILDRQRVDRELPVPLVIASALPKGDRQDFLMEKLVELGVSRFIPLETERSVAKATTSALERMRRHVMEASKQCRRNVLMEIAEPVSIPALVRLTETKIRAFAHPAGTTLSSLATTEPATIAIGPEGGFSPGDLQHFQESLWTSLALGPRILRMETAAIAIASVWSLSGRASG